MGRFAIPSRKLIIARREQATMNASSTSSKSLLLDGKVGRKVLN